MRMATFRVHKTANYTIMSNYHLRSRTLSLKGKGLLSLMLSLPEDWDYSVSGLSAISKEGLKAIRSTLKELEEEGYLIRTRVNAENGTFDYIYDIYEQPHNQKGHAVEGIAENGTQIITNKPKKDNQIDKIDKIDKRVSTFTEENSNINIGKPNCFTKELIKYHYIEEDDLFLSMFNQLFVELIEEYDFETIRACLWYFIKRLDNNGNVVDENGYVVENKFGYLKTALYNGANKLNTDYDPFSDEAINQTLELFNK